MEPNQRHENLSVKSAALKYWVKMHGVEVSVETVKAVNQKFNTEYTVLFCIRVIAHLHAIVCDGRKGAPCELLT